MSIAYLGQINQIQLLRRPIFHQAVLCQDFYDRQKQNYLCAIVVYRLNHPKLPICYSCKLNCSELQTKIRYEEKSST